MSRMDRFREWTRTPAGRIVSVAVAAAGLFAAFVSVRSYLGGSAGAVASSERTFVCAETGKPFGYMLVAGDTLPVASPHSGKKTGYPAESCNWTADGQVRAEPVLVLLEEYKDKGKRPPTFCPDCGRRVVARNPLAVAGERPPPTKAEYEKRSLARQPADPGRD